jgi:predicted aldo/keto reductase-like oxidoreductase
MRFAPIWIVSAASWGPTTLTSLLHCLTDPRWPEKMRQVMDVIDEAQEKGVVRTKGVSCHSLGALQAAANEPWVEVDLADQLAGKVMDAEPATVATA